MKEEYNCLVCKYFDPDNIVIDHRNAMICFCRNNTAKLNPCRKFELNEAKYNAKRFKED